MEAEITFQPSFTGLYQTDSYTSSWTLSVGQRKGTLYMPSSLTQTGRGACKGESQPYPETTEVLPILNLQQHWRQKEEAAHIPSGMWCPLLCLLKFCWWVGKQFVGLADIFLLCKCARVGKLCLLLIKFEIPKGKSYVSLLYGAWCPTHYG